MTFQPQIDATHPMNEDAPELAIEADSLAMRLVGERHDKRDLVDLVRWLILRNPGGMLSNYPSSPTAADGAGGAEDKR